jgi:hypothetical protein
MNNQKGQILLVVFMLLIFTGIMVAGTAFLWQSAVNTTALEKDSLRAFYLAQAGIERGRAEISFHNSNSYSDHFDNPSFGGGSYEVDISNHGIRKEIVSTGRYGNSTRVINMTVAKNPGGPFPQGNAWGYWANREDAWKEQ